MRAIIAIVGFLIAFSGALPPLIAQRLSDITIRYAYTTIEEATLEKVGKLDVDFDRHNLEAELGVGQAFVGLTYQYATKDKRTKKFGNTLGRTEDGAMLTAGFNYIFSSHFRLDTYGRLRIWGNTNPAQALYATDTDFRLNLVMFSPDGMAMLSHRAIFPASHIGVNVNKFGRVQGIAGVGLWWSGIGAYLTGFTAFNGVEEPLNPGKDADKIFATLKNRGVTLGVTYEFRGFMIWVRQNRALKNGGNDLTFTLQYQRFFQKRRTLDAKR